MPTFLMWSGRKKNPAIWELGAICYYIYQLPSSFVWLPDDSMERQRPEVQHDLRDDINKSWTMCLIVLKIICVNFTKTIIKT